MRSKLIVAIVVLLSGSTAVLAQTKISGTLKCGKSDVELSIEVGDRPNHTFVIEKGGKCTWTKPPEIAGMKAKDDTGGWEGASFTEISGTKFSGHGYGVDNWANGDKSYIYTQETGIIKDGVPEAEGTWTFTGGTGKLKGLKGKGTYKGKRAADGSVTGEMEGEYELPK
jgi:hypothetical protein